MGAIKEKLKKIKCVVGLYSIIRVKMDDYYWREHRVSWGKENPDKTFFVIRRVPAPVGLGAYVNSDVGFIEYALKKGYIPVIDMQFYENTYLDKELLGKENSWEYYFEQPCGFTMENIRNSKNIILSGRDISVTGFSTGEFLKREDIREKWQAIAHKYLRVNKKILSKTDDLYNEWFGKSRVLGVLCRGTDYIQLRPHLHSIQPGKEMALKKVEEVYRSGNYDYIFLATEDEQIYQYFYEYFGNILKAIDSKRYTDVHGLQLAQTDEFSETNKRLNGEKYLQSMIMLSKCNSLISGICGGGGMYSSLEGEYIFSF